MTSTTATVQQFLVQRCNVADSEFQNIRLIPGRGAFSGYVHPGSFTVTTPQDHQHMLELMARQRDIPMPSLVEAMNGRCRYVPLVLDLDKMNPSNEQLYDLCALTARMLALDTIECYVSHSPPNPGAHIHFPHRALPASQHDQWLAKIHQQFPTWQKRTVENKVVGIDPSIYRSGLRANFCPKGGENRLKVPWKRIVVTLIDHEIVVSSVVTEEIDNYKQMSNDDRLRWLKECSVLFFDGYNDLAPAAPTTTTRATNTTTTTTTASTSTQTASAQATATNTEHHEQWIIEQVRRLLGDPQRTFSKKRTRQGNALIIQFHAKPGDICPSGSGQQHENAAGGYYVMPHMFQPMLRCHSDKCKGSGCPLVTVARNDAILNIMKARYKRASFDDVVEAVVKSPNAPPSTIPSTTHNDDNNGDEDLNMMANLLQPAQVIENNTNFIEYTVKVNNKFCYLHKKDHDMIGHCHVTLTKNSLQWFCRCGVSRPEDEPHVHHDGLLTANQTRMLNASVVREPIVYEGPLDPSKWLYANDTWFKRHEWDEVHKSYRMWPMKTEGVRMLLNLVEEDDWKAWIAQVERVDHIIFDPSQSGYERIYVSGETRYYNTWYGWLVQEEQQPAGVDDETFNRQLEQRCAIILEVIRDILCDGDSEKFEYMLNYFAHLFQRPRELPRVALVLQSDLEGVGKGSIMHDLMRKIIPSINYAYISDSAQLEGQFNGFLKHRLIVFFDEAFWGGDPHVSGKLKSMITNETLMINEKHRALEDSYNTARIIIASNNAKVVPANAAARRYAVYSIYKTKSKDFFTQLHNAIKNPSVVTAFFTRMRRRVIDVWHPNDMPKLCRESLWDQIVMGGLTTIQTWVYAMLENPPRDRISGTVHKRSCLYEMYISTPRNGSSRQPAHEKTFWTSLMVLLGGAITVERYGIHSWITFKTRAELCSTFEQLMNGVAIDNMWSNFDKNAPATQRASQDNIQCTCDQEYQRAVLNHRRALATVPNTTTSTIA